MIRLRNYNYYSCGFVFFCSGKVDSDHLGDGKNYPQCSDCSLKAPVKRPKRSKKLSFLLFKIKKFFDTKN